MGNVESDAQMRLKVAPCVKADTLDRETIAGNQKVKKNRRKRRNYQYRIGQRSTRLDTMIPVTVLTNVILKPMA